MGRPSWISEQKLKLCNWYKIKGHTIYVTLIDFDHTANKITVTGFKPEDYAAYVCQHYFATVAPNSSPQKIADIERIPYPETISITFTKRCNTHPLPFCKGEILERSKF